MARPGSLLNPKDDDDSWGKLASDLLGINLEEAPDLDFPEPEPPPVAAAPPEVRAPVPEPQRAAPEETAESAVEPPAEEPPVSEVREPVQDDYWDALESWNWEEAAATAKPDRREEGRDRSRSDRPRRDRGDRRGGDRHRSEPGRREDRPSRADAPPRRSREDRATTERPPSHERPEHRRAVEPPRKSPPQRVSDDDFAAGLFEDASAADANVWSQKPAASPAPRRAEVPQDDFVGDLLDDAADQERGVSAGDSGIVRDAEERPRRRRRRRRGGNRPVESRPAEEFAPTVEPDDEFEAESDSEPAADIAAEDEGLEAGEPAAARPRRRRRRRRGGSERTSEARASSPAEAADSEEYDEAAAAEPTHVAAERSRSTVSYEDIPTWEEAISYLVTRSREPSRGSGERERRGPRRPARRPARDDAGDVD